MSEPLLGWIPPSQRTAAQNAAHAAFLSKAPKFALPDSVGDDPVKVALFDFWKDERVVKDVGFVFTRFRQLTGSCVGVGGGNALFSLIAVQRCLPNGATKAFIPWWPFSYGRSRYLMGDRNKGDGSLGSTFASTIVKEGVMSASEPGLPNFRTDEGMYLSSREEYDWSDGDSSLVTKWMSVAKEHPLGSAAELRDVNQVKVAICNGYSVTFACNNFVGRASIQGSGSDAVAVGRWDTFGPHQQSIHAYWKHPTLGPLYWAQNSWGDNTYPKDPAGGPVCGCWVKERDVEAAMRLDAEVFALSHLDWFPAQPDVMSWYM